METHPKPPDEYRDALVLSNVLAVRFQRFAEQVCECHEHLSLRPAHFSIPQPDSDAQFVAVGPILIVASTGIGLSGAGAFSSTGADRPMIAEVVEDDTAYVGYDSLSMIDVNVTKEIDEELVTITNRFHTPIRVTDVETENPAVDVSLPSEFGAGESGIVRLTGCDESVDDESVHPTVVVEVSSPEATLFGDTSTRTVVRVSRARQPPSSPALPTVSGRLSRRL